MNLNKIISVSKELSTLEQATPYLDSKIMKYNCFLNLLFNKPIRAVSRSECKDKHYLEGYPSTHTFFFEEPTGETGNDELVAWLTHPADQRCAGFFLVEDLMNRYSLNLDEALCITFNAHKMERILKKFGFVCFMEDDVYINYAPKGVYPGHKILLLRNNVPIHCMTVSEKLYRAHHGGIDNYMFHKMGTKPWSLDPWEIPADIYSWNKGNITFKAFRSH